jgi:hypothetical protein
MPPSFPSVVAPIHLSAAPAKPMARGLAAERLKGASMSEKHAVNKTAAAPGRGPAESGFDMFDSLKQARTKAKQTRQKRLLPSQNEVQGEPPPDEE